MWKLKVNMIFAIASKWVETIVHVILPMFLGGVIYLLFRGLDIIDPEHRFLPLLQTKGPNWLLYNLPDGLWLYALIYALSIIWQHSPPKILVGWLLFVIALSYMSEMLQALDVIPGTFDWADLVFYTGAVLIFFFVNLKTHR